MSEVEQVPGDLVARVDVPARWPAISARLARRLTTEGRVPSWRVGARVWVSASDVDAYIASCRSVVVSTVR